jgi:hypothetical protein
MNHNTYPGQPQNPERPLNAHDLIQQHGILVDYPDAPDPQSPTGEPSQAVLFATTGLTIDFDELAKAPAASGSIVVETTKGSYVTDLQVLFGTMPDDQPPRAAAFGEKGKAGRLDTPVTIGQPWDIARRLTDGLDGSPVERVGLLAGARDVAVPSRSVVRSGPNRILAAAESLQRLRKVSPALGNTAIRSAGQAG